jgi:enoyl-CoA hydratase/carnithine racemase
MSEQMETIEVRREGRVGILEFTRPDKLNAMNNQMARELPVAFKDLTDDDGVHAVLVCGQGRAFCSGADLKDPEIHAGSGILDHHRAQDTDMVENFARCPKPVIAAVQGYCVGGGMETLVAADFGIAATDAIFFLSQITIGIIPAGGGITRLVQKINSPWASRLVLTGERIDAAKALEIGLVTEVVEPEALRERGMELAQSVAQHPHDGLWLAKEALVEAWEMPLSVALKVDRYRSYPLMAAQAAEHA